MKIRKLNYFKLSETKKEEWREKIYQLAFDAVPDLKKEDFDTYFFDNQIGSMKYYVAEDKNQKLSAFFCTYFQILKIDKRKHYIFNARVIVSPNYQGKSILIGIYLAQFKAYGRLALAKGGYWVSNAVNPISYHAVVRTAKEAYPRFDMPLTSETSNIIRAVAEINQYKTVETKNIIKTMSGIPPKYSKTQIEKIYQSDKPHIKYFLEQEIDFLNGEGILVLIPLTVKNLFHSLFGILWRKIERINMSQFFVLPKLNLQK